MTSVAVAGRPGRAVSQLAIRQIRRGGLIVAVLAGGMTAIVAATFDQVMADPAAAGSLQALASNPAIRTLFGDPIGLDTAGGFTVWRVGTVTTVLLGAWAILATTRTTRGEEEGGRWDLLLSGRITLTGALARHLAAVMAIAVATAVGITGALIASGTPAPGALIHGMGTGLAGLFFGATAALAAQIFPTRTPATGTAVAVLAVTLLARMIGDGVPALGWLRWLSPFGLMALSEPYVHNRAVPLLVLLAAAATVTVAVPLAAARRDVRGGLVAPPTGRPARLRLLDNVEAFAIRRVLRPLTGWALGIGAYFLLIGLTATSVTEFLAGNPALAGQAAEAGFADLGSVAGFAATLFALLAMPVGGFATVRLSAFVAAETDQRLALLAAQPISRARLLGAETAATAAAAVLLISVAGLTTWAGVALTGGHLALTAALHGVWNTFPVVLLSLGAAVLATGWAPRWTGVLGALPAIGGFLLLVIADSVAAPAWVKSLSPYSHLAPVPLAGADWAATAVMLALTAVLTVAGLAGYRQRDLRS
ncbi:ABC transporter permease [Paractinoplanes atraurantiacus]|uniref:ABC-2 type transport system permease protein n=1 Tax=Paractinoplanes atraurantiacus TaxID=1036182 RepID=A0A285GR31_9ACTN|nr:polyketide antibiotic transporter [Actinoplanes atraurantiacus]SNY25694.1 ABC-2 type transport system permease protein [Actinoplanes atraurantiacus]